MELDQRSIAVFLYLQGKIKKTVYEEMIVILKDKCVSYQTVTRFIREFQISQSAKPIQNPKKINEPDEVDDLIRHVVDNEPFLSVRQIAKKVGMPKSTVYLRMTVNIGYISKHLKWVPHLLNPQQKKNRMDISKMLLKILQSAERQGWKYFVTGDESWFYLSYDYERQWVYSGQEPNIREKKMISSEKVMITVFWNPHQIVLVDALPKGEKFNSHYYTNNILEKLHQLGGGFPDTNGKRLNVHVDNAKPHTSKYSIRFLESHGMKKVPHPAFSPDLAPSDFFLFGYLKKCLEGQSFQTRDELFSMINQILSEIPEQMLKDSFEEWKKRLEEVIRLEGSYL